MMASEDGVPWPVYTHSEPPPSPSAVGQYLWQAASSGSKEALELVLQLPNGNCQK